MESVNAEIVGAVRGSLCDVCFRLVLASQTQQRVAPENVAVDGVDLHDIILEGHWRGRADAVIAAYIFVLQQIVTGFQHFRQDLLCLTEPHQLAQSQRPAHGQLGNGRLVDGGFLEGICRFLGFSKRFQQSAQIVENVGFLIEPCFGFTVGLGHIHAVHVNLIGFRGFSGSARYMGVLLSQYINRVTYYCDADTRCVEGLIDYGSQDCVVVFGAERYSRMSCVLAQIARDAHCRLIVITDKLTAPLAVGADIMAGSFIKNPGGGITPTGGYIAGRKDLVEKCSHRFTAPGIGGDLGCTQDSLRDTFLGFYYAPGVVCEALKTAIYAQCLLELAGVNPVPRYTADHNDIVTCFDSGSAAALTGFCAGIQHNSPVDSFASPEPADEPGYTDKVVMASGSFTEGSTIEISCDGPLRAPYTCYLQGGVNFTAGRAAVLNAVQNAFFAE